MCTFSDRYISCTRDDDDIMPVRQDIVTGVRGLEKIYVLL